jgi:hypothetical protein
MIIGSNINAQNNSNGNEDEEYEIYDLVSPKTLEIDNEFYLEVTKYGQKMSPKLTENIVIKDITFPSITFRYGVIKNFEIQLNTGYRGINAENTFLLDTKGQKKINITGNISGLSNLSFGFKAGLFSEKAYTPSIAITSLVTLPKVGHPAFQSENPGLDLTLNLYKSLGNNFDFGFDLGGIWNGSDEYPTYVYNISPSVYASDDLSFFAELTGYLTYNSKTDNRIDGGIDYTFSDYFEGQFLIGTSFQIKKLFFIGASLSVTIPF